MRLLLFLFILGFQTYALASDQWTQRANFGSFGRHRGTGIGVANKAYCGLGHLNGTGFDTYYADWWEYDPATNSWSQKADYPGNNGNGEHDVVIMATETEAFLGCGVFDQHGFYKYDTQTNTWTQMASSPPAAVLHNLHGFTIGHKGYFPSLSSTGFYEYDTDTDTWTMLGPLPFVTFFGIPTFTIGDKGYIKDGALFFEYDPSTDIWTQKALFPGIYVNRPKGISKGGYGYFVGGMTPSWVWGADVWRYDPTTDAWAQMDDFPGTIRRWATLVNVNERVYYGLGTNGTNFNDWWEFNPIATTDEFDLNSFDVYPTPATDFVNFKSDAYNNFEIQLFDLQGSSVAAQSTSNGSLQLHRDKLAAGTYIYHILIDGRSAHSDRVVFN